MKLNLIRIFLNDPRRKSLFRILFEFSRFLLTDRIIANQYFSKYLYHKGVTNFSDFLLTRKRQGKCWRLNNDSYISLLDNKYLFEVFFGKRNIPVVKSYAYNINSLFFKDNEVIQINSIPEFYHFLSGFFSKETSGNLFIKKKEGSCGGKYIFKITAHDLKNNPEKIRNVFFDVVQSGFLFQKEISQHEQLNRLNPCCINSIRMDTFTNKYNVTHLMSSFIRLGANGSIVDNVSSGGMLVGIDTTSGKLLAEGFTDFSNGLGRTFRDHPDTGIRFKDYPIPFFNESKELVIKAAQQIPQVKIIGWDVAIQPEGPVLIEGNEHPGIRQSERAQRGFKNNPVFMEMLNEAVASF